MKAKNGLVARWVRRVLFGLAVIAVAVLAIRAARPKPLPVDAAKIARGGLRVTVTGSGKTRVKDRYVLSAPLAGDMPRLELRPGDAVEAGSVLLAIAPSAPPLLDDRSRAQATAKLAAANAAKSLADARIELAKTTIAAAQKDYDRIKSLYDKSAATQVELEGVDFKLRSAKSDLESAKFSGQISAYEAQVAALAVAQGGEKPGTGFAAILKTPVTGSVLRVYQESAGLVAPGTPLLEVGDLTRMEIVVDLLSTEAVRVKPGADAAISHWGGAGELLARVRKVEPSGFTKVSALGIEEQRVNVVADFVTPHDQWKALGDGYRVEVTVTTESWANVPLVPAGALFRKVDAWSVYVIKNGRTESRVVQLGARSDEFAEVKGGLVEGDVVVLHPGDAVTDGTQVVPR